MEPGGSCRQNAGLTNRKRIEGAQRGEQANRFEAQCLPGRLRRRSDRYKREGECVIPGEIWRSAVAALHRMTMVGKNRTFSDVETCAPCHLVESVSSIGERNPMENFYYAQITSPIGLLNLAVSENGLVALEFNRGQFPPTKNKGISWIHAP